MHYRRFYSAGGCYFFTVVAAGRRPIFSAPEAVAALRCAFTRVRMKHPFDIDAAVVLPDHLHCIWTLPAGDADFSTRWRLSKSQFSRHSEIRRPVWQPRFWEHHIRSEQDLARHIDYIHYNPVKHGYAARPADWPCSSFARFVGQGAYSDDWGASKAPKLSSNIGHE